MTNAPSPLRTYWYHEGWTDGKRIKSISLVLDDTGVGMRTTWDAREGLAGADYMIKNFGPLTATFEAIANSSHERWHHDLPREEIQARIKAWRARCKQGGYHRLISWRVTHSNQNFDVQEGEPNV